MHMLIPQSSFGARRALSAKIFVLVMIGCQILAPQFARAATDTQKVATAAGGVLAFELIVDRMTPQEREALNKLPTEQAWSKVLTPKRGGWIKDLANVALTGGGANADAKNGREAQRQQILAEAQLKMGSAMPLDGFNALCAKAAKKLYDELEAEFGDKKPKGQKFVVAVGGFKFIPREGAKPDPKMAEALQNVMDALSENRELRKKYALVGFASLIDASDIIKKIGGDSDAWLNPEMTNVEDVTVKRFHPDDIYVLTGTVVAQTEGDYTAKYDLTLRVQHPRSNDQFAIKDLQSVYLFHPTKYWLTLTQDEELKKASATKG